MFASLSPIPIAWAERMASDVAAGEVSVMLLDHSSVGVAEVPRNDDQRHAVHHHQRRVGVAQGVKRNGWVHRCGVTGFNERPLLLRFPP